MRMSGVCVGGGGSKDHDQGQDTIPVRRSGIGRYPGLDHNGDSRALGHSYVKKALHKMASHCKRR